jgi:hypothetical protein
MLEFYTCFAFNKNPHIVHQWQNIIYNMTKNNNSVTETVDIDRIEKVWKD